MSLVHLTESGEWAVQCDAPECLAELPAESREGALEGAALYGFSFEPDEHQPDPDKKRHICKECLGGANPLMVRMGAAVASGQMTQQQAEQILVGYQQAVGVHDVPTPNPNKSEMN